jgi:proteic killer suppression protein
VVVRHDDPELADAEINLLYQGKWKPIVVRFRKVLNLIRQVKNEVELHNWKGLHLEKLKGKRSHQHSMRLNDQWRLIVEFEPRPGPNNNVCAVKAIEKHYE